MTKAASRSVRVIVTLVTSTVVLACTTTTLPPDIAVDNSRDLICTRQGHDRIAKAYQGRFIRRGGKRGRFALGDKRVNTVARRKVEGVQITEALQSVPPRGREKYAEGEDARAIEGAGWLHLPQPARRSPVVLVAGNAMVTLTT